MDGAIWGGQGEGAGLCVCDEAWQEMKTAGSGSRGVCQLNTERIRMNDDKIGSLFPTFFFFFFNRHSGIEEDGKDT